MGSGARQLLFGMPASMRPPEFTGGNNAAGWRARRSTSHGLAEASMRPPEFTGGNTMGDPARQRPGGARYGASMRPPEFTGGNPAYRCAPTGIADTASMRPPEFTGGNTRAIGTPHP